MKYKLKNLLLGLLVGALVLSLSWSAVLGEEVLDTLAGQTSEPVSVCVQLADCVEGAHGQGCPFYVAPQTVAPVESTLPAPDTGAGEPSSASDSTGGTSADDTSDSTGGTSANGTSDGTGGTSANGTSDGTGGTSANGTSDSTGAGAAEGQVVALLEALPTVQDVTAYQPVIELAEDDPGYTAAYQQAFAAYLEQVQADVQAARLAYDGLSPSSQAAIDPALPARLAGLEGFFASQALPQTLALGTSEASAVAQVGSNTYPTLEQALAAAIATGNSPTIKLLDNIDLGEAALTIGADATPSINLVLDLNGKTLRSSAVQTLQVLGTLTVCDTAGSGKILNTPPGNSNAAVLISGGQFTLQSGTVEGSKRGVFAHRDGATFTMTGGRAIGLTHMGVQVTGNEAGASAYISGGSIVGGKQSIAIYANQNGTTPYPARVTIDGNAVVESPNTASGEATVTVFGCGAELVVAGGTISHTGAYAAISGSGTVRSTDGGKDDGGTKITITGGTINSGNLGIYHPQRDGLLTITGGIITANATGVEMRAGTLHVSGDASISGGNSYSSAANGSGFTSSGVGVAIAQHTSKLPISVTITGGTISGAHAVDQANPQNNPQEAIDKISLLISGGTFTGDICATNLKAFILGGTFIGTVAPQARVQAKISTPNGTFYYAALQEALDALQPGQTVALCSDVTLAENTFALIDQKGSPESPVVLDLQGHTLTGSNTAAATAETSGVLRIVGAYVTLTDTAAGPKGGIDNTATTGIDSATVYIGTASGTGAAVTVEGGIHIKNQSGGAEAKALFVYGLHSGMQADLVVTNAVVSTNMGYAVGQGILSQSGSSATATLNGGSYQSGKGKTSTILSGAVKVNAGSFANWSRTEYAAIVPEGHCICVNENNTYWITVQSTPPASYVARLATATGQTLYLVEQTELFALHDAAALSLNDNMEIYVNQSAQYNPVTFFGYNQGAPQKLTFVLGDGVELSGAVSLKAAHIFITGAGTFDGFTVTTEPNYALAAGTNPGVYIASLQGSGVVAEMHLPTGEVYTYSHISLAIKDMQEGCTLKLLQDISYNGGLSLTNVQGTLDLNGHQYTCTSTTPSISALSLKKGTHLRIVNTNPALPATFAANQNIAAAISFAYGTEVGQAGNSSLYIGRGVSIVGNTLLIDDQNASLTVEGTIDTTGTPHAAIQGSEQAGRGNYSISILEGASIKSDVQALYIPQTGRVNITGGVIRGGTAIEMRAGTLRMSGGALIASGNFIDGAADSGASTNGAAIAAVTSEGYAGDIQLYISAGTLRATGTNGKAIYAVRRSGEAQPTISVTGGHFQGSITIDQAANTGILGGGWFTEAPTNDFLAADTLLLTQSKTLDGVVYSHTLGKKNAAGLLVTEGPYQSDLGTLTGQERSDAVQVLAGLQASGLQAAAEEMAAGLSVSDAQRKAALQAAGVTPSAGQTIDLVVEYYLHISVESCTSNALLLHITPKASIKATTDPANMVAAGSTGVNTALIREETLVVNQPVTISIALPAAFSTENLVVQHTKDSGRVYYYPVTIRPGDGSNPTAVFTVPHGFSRFCLQADTRSTTVTFQMPGDIADTRTYTCLDVESALPIASKAGHTFLGWGYGNEIHTHLTDMLFSQLIDGTGTGPISLAPLFRKNDTGGAAADTTSAAASTSTGRGPAAPIAPSPSSDDESRSPSQEGSSQPVPTPQPSTSSPAAEESGGAPVVPLALGGLFLLILLFLLLLLLLRRKKEEDEEAQA